jgi:Flp pilus assembly protein TadG
MTLFSHFQRTFSLRRNAAASRRLWQRLRGDRKGVAAVEFAFILPLMLTMYFVTAETTQGVTADRRAYMLKRTVGDLAARAVTIDDVERDNIFDAALAVIYPFSASSTAITITSVVIDSAGVPRVCWSEGKNVLPLTTVTIPATLRVPSTSLIVSHTTYNYKPTVGFEMTGSFTLGQEAYFMRPRQGKPGPTGIQQVERTGKPLC